MKRLMFYVVFVMFLCIEGFSQSVDVTSNWKSVIYSGNETNVKLVEFNLFPRGAGIRVNTLRLQLHLLNGSSDLSMSDVDILSHFSNFQVTVNGTYMFNFYMNQFRDIVSSGHAGIYVDLASNLIVADSQSAKIEVRADFNGLPNAGTYRAVIGNGNSAFTYGDISDLTTNSFIPLSSIYYSGQILGNQITISSNGRLKFSVKERSVGAGTFITAPITVEGDVSTTIKGFQMRANRQIQDTNGNWGSSPIDPQWFNMANELYGANWMCVANLDSVLQIAAVGSNLLVKQNPIEIGRMKFFISCCSGFGPTKLPNIDVTTDANMPAFFPTARFNIIDLPISRYEDLNNDGVFDINDAIKSFDLLYQPVSDTMAVLLDLFGEGSHQTYDVYLMLSKLVNPKTVFPIFDDNNYQLGSTSVFWKKVGSEWALVSNQQITNGDLQIQGVVVFGSAVTWKKQVDNKFGFINPSQPIQPGQPIILASQPYAVSGTVNKGSKVNVQTTTEVSGESLSPTEFRLKQNYPNPFNPSTAISYSLPSNSFVSLKVYNLLGQEVASLVNEEKVQGLYSVNFNGQGLASGAYIYKLKAGSYTETKKMILMK